MKECTWCDESTPLVMQTGIKVPFICSGCGGKLGYADWRELREMLQKPPNQEVTGDTKPKDCMSCEDTRDFEFPFCPYCKKALSD